MNMLFGAKMLFDAINFANERHAGQVRKGSGDPYVTHPIVVSYLVAIYKRSSHLVELVVAAILHDCLEDTETTFEELAARFSPLVASLCLELKNDDAAIAKVGKLAYQVKKVLGCSSYALVIKLCDRLHNISDNPTEKMVADTLVLMQRLRKGRKLSRAQSQLVTDIETLCREKQAAFAIAA
ncbi:TPA: HD domain-containing protein [Burkholderia vietnamiensis]|nr:HD domain-containing protein [Burkholderia vietnamiensis]